MAERHHQASGMIMAVAGGFGLPVDVVSSLLIGWGVAAGLHLAFGSPLGLLAPDEVAVLVGQMGVTVRNLAVASEQDWGVQRFSGRDADGHAVELSVYGRDVADARTIAKLWRFCFYRDSGRR